jgi:prepilin-type N-terminal cleavage/methylation domain-containing protein
VTLIELLCVIAIIAILASMLLPAVSRAYRRVKAMAEEMEVQEVTDLIRTAARKYCAAVKDYRFDTKADFLQKCPVPPRCQDWVRASTADFVPFGYADPTNQTVLTFHYGRKQAGVYSFTKGELSRSPD